MGSPLEVSAMFMGEYNHSIDEKGRLIIPSRFRYELGENFVLTKGLDGCLCIYPKTDWDDLMEKLHSLPLTNRNARKITRFLVSGAVACELDKQGRILVPASLRSHAGITKDVVLTGNLDRIEVWDKARWDEYSSYDDVEDIAESLADSGIMI